MKHLRKLFFAGLIAIALFSFAFPFGNASAATHNTKKALLDNCHTEGHYVNDAHGNAIYAFFTVGDYHNVTVYLMYCDRWQSNFTRAFVGGPTGSGVTLDLVIHGTAGQNPGQASAVHTIVTGQNDTSGSQDSPVYYAPSEATYACAIPESSWLASGNQCTVAV